MVFRTYVDDVLIEGDATHTFEAAEAIEQGQLVKADLNNTGRTVEPSDTDGEPALGFALYSVSAGEDVAVAMEGTVVRATSGTGTIVSGAYLSSAGGVTGEEGEVQTATDTVMSDGTAAGTEGTDIVGIALEDDDGANDDVIVYVTFGGIS